MTEENEDIGPTCLHKDGAIKTFENEAVTEALDDGWIHAREASAIAAKAIQIDDDVINQDGDSDAHDVNQDADDSEDAAPDADLNDILLEDQQDDIDKPI